MQPFTDLSQLLKRQSIAMIDPLYSRALITKWNELFNPIFASQKSARRYVSAINFVELGIFDEIFSTNLLSTIYHLIPDAVLYHCHAYEIDANQAHSHIMNNNGLDGWHRDYDCKHDLSNNELQHVSLFIYLSNVEKDSGAFEVSNMPLTLRIPNNADEQLYQVQGASGTTFLFNRIAYHRASPNRSATPRRVLKLSFQSKALFNHKLLEDNFARVSLVITNKSPLIRQLFGDKDVDENEHKQALDHLVINSSINAQLPRNSIANTFNWHQNARRYYRDIKFIVKRLSVKLKVISDTHRPAAKY